MSQDTLVRATEPFFTTKGVGKGTGLGLSMVQGFAEQSGGRIKISSTLGEGTIVEMWLPATDGEVDIQTQTLSHLDATSDFRKLTVLTVDDDFLVRMGTAAMLEDLGHAVIEASSGAEALEVFTQHSEIDLVMTDQAMPKMTGIELAEAILKKQPNIPIIIASGYAELPVGSGAKLPRLSKPFTQEQLVSALKLALKLG